MKLVFSLLNYIFSTFVLLLTSKLAIYQLHFPRSTLKTITLFTPGFCFQGHSKGNSTDVEGKVCERLT